MPNITRREFIPMSLCSFLGLTAIAPLLQASAGLDKNNNNISWQEFIEKIKSMAPEYGKEGFDEDAYLKKVSEMANKLHLNDKAITDIYENYNNRRKNFPEFTKMHKELSFEITLLEFEAGEKIPLHNHPDMSGVILCSSGKIAIDNFDLLKEKSTNDKLLLNFVSSVELTTGMVGSLSSTKGNIHQLEAKEFTRLIDIFTPPYDKKRIEESKFFAKNKEIYNNTKGLFEAVVK